MAVEDVEINGKVFHLIYTDARLASKLSKVVRKLNNPRVVNHLAVVPASKSVFLAAKIKPKEFENLLSKVYDLALSLA